MTNRYLILIASVLLCLGVGFIGSLFTTASIPTWYASLNKPFFAPPNYVFGPVWTTLYILMGIAFYLILTAKKSKNRQQAINIFIMQLILNFCWSIIFFGMRNPLLAFIEIILLWILIFLTIKLFATVNKTASYLLYPYIAWVSFASILNLAIVLLN